MPGRVLIAHEASAVALVRPALVAAGLVPTVVADGDAALAHGLSGRHDVLLLGTGLPRRDGLTVVRQLRAAGAVVPVILLGPGCGSWVNTGHGGGHPVGARTDPAADHAAELVAAGLDAGADDYMAMPPRTDELLARIRLRLRRARGVADLTPWVPAVPEQWSGNRLDPTTC